MDAVQTNIEKSARIAAIAIKIVWICLWLVIIVLAGLLLMTLVIYWAEGPAGFSAWIAAENLLEVFGPNIVVPAGLSPLDMFLRGAGIFLVSAMVYLALLAAMLRSMGKIFSDIRKTLLPFTKINAQRLKRAAVYMALMAVVPPVIGVTGGFLLNIPVESLYFGIELLIPAAVLYSFAHIFEYGVLLQQQADETL